MNDTNRSEELCEDLSPLTFHNNINSLNKDDIVIIDVRTPDEYKSGHIRGAINIDYYNKNFLSVITQMDPLLIYFIYCRRGNRSMKTLEMMRAKGYLHLHQMLGGIDSWVRCELPLTKE